MPRLSVRPALERDLERVIAIHTSAFPDPRGFEARVRNFKNNPFGGFAFVRVIEDEGTIVGHACLYAVEAFFGGARVKCGGIASVGVAPEARGRGVAGELLRALHDESRGRGDAVTILHAFRQGFYARHGYAPVTPYKQLRFSPQAVPRAWKVDGVRAMEAGDRVGVEAAYARAAERGTGMLARKRAQWEYRFLDERRVWLVVERGRAIAGYVAWTIEQEEAHAQTTMRVHELLADDEETRRALFAAIGAQRDQVTEARLDAAIDDPIDLELVDADRARFGTAEIEHTLGALVAGPMVRIADPQRALTARGYPAADESATHELTFAIENGASHSVVFRLGALKTAKKGRDKRVVATSAPGLAAVLYGGVSPDAALRLGWLRADPELVPAVRMLALPPYFALDPF